MQNAKEQLDRVARAQERLGDEEFRHRADDSLRLMESGGFFSRKVSEPQ